VQFFRILRIRDNTVPTAFLFIQYADYAKRVTEKYIYIYTHLKRSQTRMWANSNVMVALPNIGGTLCSTPQSLADAHY